MMRDIDINTKELKKNAWRITKNSDKTALRIRVPGGHLETKYFGIIQEIADRYGNGSVHITTRQGFEIPDIPLKKEIVDEINAMIAPIIEGLELEIGVPIEDLKKGYPAAGTRNVSGCIGNRVCPFANYDTTDLALKIEKAIYPNHRHVKIAVTGCPNDCIKAHMQDFGVIGQNKTEYDFNQCIGCLACMNNCEKRVTGALRYQNFKVVKDEELCIGCGECVMKCPTGAFSRGKTFYKVVIMGRTGKKNPRIAETFAEWVEEDVVIQMIKNSYDYIERYIDPNAPEGKEHVGYIVDRTGYQIFKEEILSGINLNPEAKIAEQVTWGGYWYKTSKDKEKNAGK